MIYPWIMLMLISIRTWHFYDNITDVFYKYSLTAPLPTWSPVNLHTLSVVRSTRFKISGCEVHRLTPLVFFMCWSWYQLCKHYCVPLSLCLCSAKLSTMTILLCYKFFLELHEHGIMACLERKKWQIPSWFKPLFFQLNSKFIMCYFYFYAPCNCLVLHRYDLRQWISFKGFSGTFLTNWLLTFCFFF